ncbi:hypothetical protein [Antrihabitans cavernicola]|uniref:Uncharacterized protein n=1 Tax=Antrihabitans cavernicola TaxID=2495913 RepID=A0A5A7SBH1_9NOCA|nr:hypothetical protein [Spelaeibacter cavernicola]KAA0022502.1 hypothetical protein FOY51_12415 [Spelaeibacter cavernicola]
MKSKASTSSKSIAWCVFLAGLIGAGVGIGNLQVVAAVFWLIVASVSGLMLLKQRADSRPTAAPLVREIQRPSTELHSQAA